MDKIPTKHIDTMAEYVAIQKSHTRPDAISSNNGDLARPSLESISKAVKSPSVKMGRGVDPHKVVENDLEDYMAWKYGSRCL